METKICSKCGRELPISEFNKNKSHKDGHLNRCKECVKQYNKQYYIGHKEEYAERDKQRYQDNKEAIIERQRQYYEKNKEVILEYKKNYRQEHKDEILEYMKQYRSTPIGRAYQLVSNYKQSDKEYNRGECTITPEWVIDNIFTSKCHWCEETDWHKLGCDRIDNSKPHTPDNVNPCCDECNKKRGTMSYEEFLKIKKAPITYV